MGGKGLAGELGINTQVCLRQNEGWGGGVVEKMGEWERREAGCGGGMREGTE